MKRFFCALTLACLAGAALAQAPFTIVRPADGAKVREKVRILLPKNSIPKSGYVGIFLDGKFVEAVIPNLVGRYHEYILDTKGRGLADGKHVLEAVLYVEFSDEPRIVDRSSIEITIANKANVPLPEEGLRLRYKFRAGTEWTYTMMQRVALNTITARQQALGGRAAELPLDFEKVRMMYAVDNAYGNGDGLVRMQALPMKGKKFAMLTTSDSARPQMYWETEMHPIYMRLTSTGTEVFGSIPEFIPFEGVRAQSRTDLFAAFPLPTLPTKPVKPGDVWQTRFQTGAIDLMNLHRQTSVIESIPARGEFIGLEWEMGHPCAKIRHTLAVGGKPSNGLTANRSSMDETVWFALDLGLVIKVIRLETQDRLVAGPPPPPSAQAPASQPPARPGADRGRQRGTGRGSFADEFQREEVPFNLGGQGKTSASSGQGGASGSLTGGRAASGAAPGSRYERLAIQQIFILEQ